MYYSNFLPKYIIWHNPVIEEQRRLVFQLKENPAGLAEKPSDSFLQKKAAIEKQTTAGIKTTKIELQQDKKDSKKEKAPALSEDLIYPRAMKIKGDELFIIDGGKVKVYSLKDQRLVATFVKTGEGPGELQEAKYAPPQLQLLNAEVICYSLVSKKLLHFLPSGDHKWELTRETPKHTGTYVQLLALDADTYIGQKFLYQGKREEGAPKKLVICLLDKNLKDELAENEMKVPPLKFFLNLQGIMQNKDGDKFYLPELYPIIQIVGEDKVLILVDTEKGFKDEMGKGFPKTKTGFRVYEGVLVNNKLQLSLKIDLEYKKLKSKNVVGFSEEEFKKDLQRKEVPAEFFELSDELPVAQYMVQDGDRLYVQTYEQQNGKCKFLVFDLKSDDPKGKIQEIFLPVQKMKDPISFTAGPETYTIVNGIYYQLIEDEDNEKWDLYREKINLQPPREK